MIFPYLTAAITAIFVSAAAAAPAQFNWNAPAAPQMDRKRSMFTSDIHRSSPSQLTITNHSADMSPLANLNCRRLVYGLRKADCDYMPKIGFAAQGVNACCSNDKAWIGSNAPYTYTFTNRADKPRRVSVTIVVWRPSITYSLPKVGDKVTIALLANVNGAFAALTDYKTKLSYTGQIFHTWGEFSTGKWATPDVSREINMGGDGMHIKASNGCLSDMNKCVFKCKKGNTCGTKGTYMLHNCEAGSQPGAGRGSDPVTHDPSGGCGGWGYNGSGHLDVTLGYR